jgi:hypothetical protein
MFYSFLCIVIPSHGLETVLIFSCVSKNNLFCRFEIEKKLRLAKKQEMRKKRDQEKKKEEKMDAKERSKERKKTVEENRGKVDKKAAAMNMLKARREEKRERGMMTEAVSVFRCHLTHCEILCE